LTKIAAGCDQSLKDAPHEEIHGRSMSRACRDDATSLRGKTPQDEITCRVDEYVARDDGTPDHQPTPRILK
jgi:hypothetical protein